MDKEQSTHKANPTQPGSTRSIHRDMLLALILVVVVISTLTSIISYQLLADRTRATYESIADEYIEILKDSITQPLWNLDNESIGRMGDRFIQRDSIFALKIESAKGQVLFDRTNAAGISWFNKTADIHYQNQKIGHIRLGIDKRRFQDNVQRLLLTSLFTVILLVLGIGIGIGMVHRSILGSPLERLIASVQAVKRGEYESEGVKSQYREFALIGEEFRDMAHEVNSREQTLVRLNSQLEEGEARFRQLANSTWEAVLIHDQGVAIQVNDQFTEIFGYVADELIGRPAIPLIVAPESIETVQAHIASDDPTPYEATGLRKDGSKFPMEIRIRNIEFEGRSVRVAAMRDVTQQKENAQSLIEEKEFTDALINSQPGMFYVYRVEDDGSTRLIRWNQVLETSMGYGPGELADRDSLSWFSGEERDRIEAEMARMYETGKAGIEANINRKDGSTVPHYFNATVLVREGQTYIIGTALDTSELRQAETAQKMLTAAIEQAVEAFAITGPSGDIQYINSAFETLTGYSKKEMLGQDLHRLYPEESISDLNASIRFSIADTGNWQGRLTYRRKDGSEYTAEATISTVRDNAGEIINHVQIHRDITDELSMERRLSQTQKMEAIGTLAGGITHDFNNILSAIFGFTDLAMMDCEDEQVSGSLDQIRGAATRAQKLVAQILAFSRQASAKIESVQVAALVKEIAKLMRASLPATIEIKCEIEDGAMVMADPIQLHQILMNLCTNAGHAMRQQGGVLKIMLKTVELDAAFISTRPSLSAGPHLKLTVEDTGTGIPKKIREKIFDPFFTTKAQGEGTGMGLSVVHGIVTKYGGSIEVYSEEGQGSVFNIFLPAIEFQSNVERVESASLPTGTEHILFVDDESLLVELGKSLLGELGYRVTGMENSVDALDIFSASPQDFDLLITDMTMPNMTGDELAKRLLAIKPELPIILCTGYSEHMSAKTAEEIGIKGFALKPVILEELAGLIREVLAD